MSTTEQNKWKAFFLSRWFLLGIFVLTILIVFTYARAYYRDYQVKQEIARLKEEVRRLESKRLETVELLKFVQSKEFVEQKAHTELNLVKPGENLTVIDEAFSVPTGNTRQDDSQVLKLSNISNPMKWWLYFMGGEE